MSGPQVIQQPGIGNVVAEQIQGITATLARLREMQQQEAQRQLQAQQARMGMAADASLMVERQQNIRQSQQQIAESRARIQREDEKAAAATQLARQRETNFEVALRGVDPQVAEGIRRARAMHDMDLPADIVHQLTPDYTPEQVQGLRRRFPAFASLPDKQVVSTVAQFMLQQQVHYLTQRDEDATYLTLDRYVARNLPILTRPHYDPFTQQNVPGIPLAQARQQVVSEFNVIQEVRRRATMVAGGGRRPLADDLETLAVGIAPGLDQIVAATRGNAETNTSLTPGGIRAAVRSTAQQQLGRDLTDEEVDAVLYRSRFLRQRTTRVPRQ